MNLRRTRWRVGISVILFLLTLAAQTAHAATRTWTGAHATSGDWSRNANWDTAAPANGDTVVFPGGVGRQANTNDLVGLQLAAIRFFVGSSGYTLHGNAINLGDRIHGENTAGANAINLARITLDAATRFVQESGGALVIDSDVRLNGNDLTVNTMGFADFRGSISGAGNLFKNGDNYLKLSGAAGNIFGGDVFLNEGTLFMGKTLGQAVPNRLVIGDGLGGAQADVAVNESSNQVNEVVINSSGLWNLGDFTDEVSTLRLNDGGDVTTGVAGKLRLGPGAEIIVMPEEVEVGLVSEMYGNLELLAGVHGIRIAAGTDAAGLGIDLVIYAEISGPGSILKTGPGALQLSGANTFGGAVTVDGGDLALGNSLALGSTLSGTRLNNDTSLILLGSHAVVGETLTLDTIGGGSELYSTFHAVGVSSWSGDITLLHDINIGVGVGGNLSLTGVISGAGGIVKEDIGTLRLGGFSGDNTYAGTTYVNAGTLELDKGTIGGVVAVPGLLVIGDGDDLDGDDTDVVRNRKDNQVNRVTVNGSGLWDLGIFQDEVSELTLNNAGDVTTAATGLLRLGMGANVTARMTSALPTAIYFASISGNLELLPGPHTFNAEQDPGVVALDHVLSIAATITGAGGITKEGNDTLRLLAANSFAGQLTVNDGDLLVLNRQALGSTIGGTRVNNDANFRLLFDGAVGGETLTLDTTGFISCAFSAEVSWTGDVTLLRNAQIVVEDGGEFNLTGTISGAGGVTKTGPGTLLLSGNSANTYSGVTTVNEGRLQLNKAGVNVAVPGRLIIGDDVGGANADVVECLSVNEIGALSSVTVSSSGRLVARQESIGSLRGSGQIEVTSSLNVGDDNTSTTFDGVISGAGAFNKIGTGTLTFNGDNTYTGGTGIADGTLSIDGQQPAAFVLIQPAGTLGGSGRVGNLSTFAGGATVSPGASPGRLTSGNVIFGAGTVLRMELDGPVPGAQHDQLRVFGTVNLGGATLQPVLNFIPTLGQPLVIVDNDGTEDVIDQFDGLAEGDTIRLNQIPFVISYEGGDGNDVTLTATNTSISFVSTRVEAGNGDGVIDPNECNHLFVALMNETGGLLGVSRVVLDSATPGVVVTRQRSDYANFAALGIRENTAPFQIRTAPDFECGRLIEFLLTITVTGGGGGTFTIPFSVPSGGAGAPVVFNNAVNTALVDQGQLVSALSVSGAVPLVGKATVSLHITHPSAGDLVLRLQSPSGTIVPLALNLGGTGDNYGGGCGNQANRTTFDDAAPIRIAAGTAPFTGSFTPDSPLAAFRGEDPNGDWKLLIADTVAGDTGELRCWSLLISPPDCSDGGGQCETCVPNFSGRSNADMPSTTTRLVRNGMASGCGSAKVCPTVTTGARLFYRVHLVTNSGPATCVSVVLSDLCRTSNLRLHAAAYLGSYNPADPCANYLGDTGSELVAGSTSFSFAAPQDAVIAIVVSSPVTATTCPVSYSVQLHGLPCPPPTIHIEKTANPDEVRLFWSTAYPDFDLQRTPNLNGAAPYPFVNVPFTPFVVNGDYSVTNATTGNDAYYRLRKP